MDSQGRGALFLDRDGVILELVDYLHQREDLRLMPGIAEVLGLLNRAEVPVIVITNQSGVARGILTEDALADLHDLMRRQLAAGGAEVDAIYYCPHHPEAGQSPYRRVCDCRKPAPGMLLQAAAELGIDLGRSAFIGDTLADMEAAWNAGIGTAVMVLTGHGKAEFAALEPGHRQPDRIEADAPAAVQALISEGLFD